MPEKITSFQDFIQLVKGLSVSITYGDPTNRYDRHRYTYGTPKQKAEELKKPPYIYVEWSTGGVSGGSCYDTGDEDPHHAYSSSDPEGELTDLDLILEHINPGITFLQYKNLTRDIIETSSRTENEYYGNYTNYAMKKCNLEKLYDALVERGMF